MTGKHPLPPTVNEADTELTSKGKKNPAWGMNTTIGKILEDTEAKKIVNLVACKTCFETAIFGEEAKDEKPYNALEKIRSNPEIKVKVQKLLDYLICTDGVDLPENCIHWSKIEQLA